MQEFYTKLINKFEKKLLDLSKKGKYNTEIYNLYKQVIEDLNQKLRVNNGR